MRVFATTEFHKEKRKALTKMQQEQLEEFIKRLGRKEQRGKRLRKWLYEVKLRGKRAYYVSNEKGALFVGVSGKKDQNKKIRTLHETSEEFIEILKKKLSTR